MGALWVWSLRPSHGERVCRQPEMTDGSAGGGRHDRAAVLDNWRYVPQVRKPTYDDCNGKTARDVRLADRVIGWLLADPGFWQMLGCGSLVRRGVTVPAVAW